MPWLLMLGIFLLGSFPGLLFLAIIAQSLLTLFTLVTLPVEFDASRRALLWIRSEGIVVQNEYDAAKDALKWAALTYVVTALAAITQLIFLIARYSGSRRN
jgi:Zn-dependent membrane protease YugP